MKECLDDCLFQLGVEEEHVVTFTTDGGSNIKAAIANMNFGVTLWCGCHLLQRSVLDLVQTEGVKSLLQTVRDCVAFFNKSGVGWFQPDFQIIVNFKHSKFGSLVLTGYIVQGEP